MYRIYELNGEFKAKNTVMDQVVFSTDSVRNLIDDIFNVLQGGTRIHFETGEFPFKGDPLKVPYSDIEFTGNGRSSKLVFHRGFSFQIGQGELMEGVNWRNLDIISLRCSVGLHFHKVRDFLLENIRLRKFSDPGSTNILITTPEDRWSGYGKLVNCKLAGQNPLRMVGKLGLNAFKLLHVDITRSGKKDNHRQIGMTLENFNTSVIRDCSVSGFDVGLDLIAPSRKNVISRLRVENNDLDYRIGRGCKENHIEVMPKYGRPTINDQGNTKIYYINV